MTAAAAAPARQAQGPAAVPRYERGLCIGLFGGSFDPPHAAHRAASLLALKRCGLDRVWWLVTPGNPLKDTGRLPSQAARLAAAAALARHPRIAVTGVEAAFGTRYTVDTLARLVRRCPGVRFVWIMGADNLAQFHRWRRWRAIATLMPLVIVDRPGATLRAVAAPAAVALAAHRRPEAAAQRLAGTQAPSWTYLHGLKSPLSSTALRTSNKAC